MRFGHPHKGGQGFEQHIRDARDASLRFRRAFELLGRLAQPTSCAAHDYCHAGRILQACGK